MSDLHREPTSPKARKCHKCVACGYKIDVGEKYRQQEGFFDGRAYRNRYHVECCELLDNEGIFEFSAGDIEPPERLITNLK